MMAKAIFVLSVLGAALYSYSTVPSLCAEIARQKGLDETKWYFYGIFSGGFALLLLRPLLSSPSDHLLKREVDKNLLLGLVFLMWLLGLAMYLDS
jgi:hypothetical protein